MKLAQIARLVGYLAGVGLGIFMTVRGVLDHDPALVTSGIALVGVGGLAGANVPGVTGRHAKEEQ